MSRPACPLALATVLFLASSALAGEPSVDSISPEPAAWTPAKRLAVEWVDSNRARPRSVWPSSGSTRIEPG